MNTGLIRDHYDIHLVKFILFWVSNSMLEFLRAANSYELEKGVTITGPEHIKQLNTIIK